jgi:hypothetical protein
MRGTRIPFLLGDLERAIRNIAPQTGQLELRLQPGTHRPVMEALADHYGRPELVKADEFVLGSVVIRRGGL